ncbi:hypothetical protein PENTCL1PPCAC_21523, partial [Pristionchus entomophagus]
HTLCDRLKHEFDHVCPSATGWYKELYTNVESTSDHGNYSADNEGFLECLGRVSVNREEARADCVPE